MRVETVDSHDGTRIACVRSGDGSPLVLVPGATGDHTHFNALAPLLEPRFSLWMMHRRGRLPREVDTGTWRSGSPRAPVSAVGRTSGNAPLLRRCNRDYAR
jgi:hypothetical protein